MLILDSTFCSDTANIWQFVGRLVTVIKIAVPILIIILGSWDLGKAVVQSDDKAIKTATNSLIKRFVAGIVIFLLPTIVTAIFNLLQGWQDTKSDATVCFQCISNPGNGSACDTAAKAVDQDPTN